MMNKITSNNKIYLSVFSFFKKVKQITTTLTKLIRKRIIVISFPILGMITYIIATVPNPMNLMRLIILMLSIYLVTLGTYLYNDLCDFEVDILNEKKTSINVLRQKYLFYFTIVIFVTSILLAISINITTGIMAITYVIFAILYSNPNIHLETYFIIKTLITSFGTLFSSIMGLTAASHYPSIAFGAVICAFLTIWVLGPLGDIMDIKGDKNVGRRTIPIVLGVNMTFALVGFIIALMIMVGVVTNLELKHISKLGLIIILMSGGYAFYELVNLVLHYNPSNQTMIKHTRTHVRTAIILLQLAIMISIILNY